MCSRTRWSLRIYTAVLRTSRIGTELLSSVSIPFNSPFCMTKPANHSVQMRNVSNRVNKEEDWRGSAYKRVPTETDRSHPHSEQKGRVCMWNRGSGSEPKTTKERVSYGTVPEVRDLTPKTRLQERGLNTVTETWAPTAAVAMGCIDVRIHSFDRDTPWIPNRSYGPCQGRTDVA